MAVRELPNSELCRGIATPPRFGVLLAGCGDHFVPVYPLAGGVASVFASRSRTPIPSAPGHGRSRGPSARSAATARLPPATAAFFRDHPADSRFFISWLLKFFRPGHSPPTNFSLPHATRRIPPDAYDISASVSIRPHLPGRRNHRLNSSQPPRSFRWNARRPK